MKKRYLTGFLSVLILITACSKVPITGRKQFSLLPDNMINSLAVDEYKTVLQESKLITSGSDLDMIRSVGRDISTAVNTYLKENKMQDRVNDFKWEFNLIDDSKMVNAWCMPGGKVAFYTGILPYTKDATGIATVMGHEVAHAVARHGSERMTQGLAQQMGAIGLAVALQNKPAQTKELFNTAYGAGTSVAVMLPFSRKHETEADKLGLVFMAMAGYDPNQAVGFWERMAKAGGAQPPQILSTHPSHTTRIADIKKFLPTAMKYYNGSAKKTNGTTGGSKATPTNSGTTTKTDSKGGTTTKTDSKGGTRVKPQTGSGTKNTPNAPTTPRTRTTPK